MALHEGIIEAFIVEEHSGDHVVVDHASRNNSMTLRTLWAKHEQLLLPELVLGAATQFRRGLSPPKVVGISYGDVGILICHLPENQTLVIATRPETLSQVMDLTEEYVQDLPANKERVESNLVRSAIEAEDIARGYLNTRTHAGSEILIDEIEYCESDCRWIVRASTASTWKFRGRHYSTQIDAHNGWIMSSTTTSASNLRVLGLVSLLVGLSTFALVLSLILVFYSK